MEDAPVCRPRPVLPGATIGVIAPAGPVPADALEEGLKRLHGWGYRTAVGEHVLAREGYLAGTDSQRAADFNRVWGDPQVEAILCARGGYGVMRILKGIDWELVRQSPKFFCGFSDITALHLALAREANLVTFHGPMVAAFGGAQAYNAAGLLGAMQEAGPLGRVKWPDPAEAQAPFPLTIRSGVAEGRLLGGNLSLIVSLLGTPWEPDFTGRIVVIEDVDEAPYRIDRMLMQLLLAGKLQQAAGILFGDSPTCLEGPTGRPSLTLLQVLEGLLGPLGIPVLYGFPCGHAAHRATLPLGVMARLDAGSASLTLLEPAVAQMAQ